MVPSRDERQCVLIIEDEPTIRELLACVLGDEGYSVVAVTDCRRASVYLRANAPPQLLLMDYNLPRLNGAAFVRMIQSNLRLRDIPVVMMSAALEAERAARNLGIAAFLSKPFDADELIAVVRRLVPQCATPRRVRIYPSALLERGVGV